MVCLLKFEKKTCIESVYQHRNFDMILRKYKMGNIKTNTHKYKISPYSYSLVFGVLPIYFDMSIKIKLMISMTHVQLYVFMCC